MGRINIAIPEEHHRQAKVAAALRGITLIQYINEAIEEKLQRQDAKKR